MPPPEKIGQVGTVVIEYRAGHSGPMDVRSMSKNDFDNLAAMVNAYAELDRIAEHLDAPQNQQVRKDTSAVLGLRYPSPHRRIPSKKFDFTMYTLKGLVRRVAVAGMKKVTLEPKYIKRVEFKTPVNVAN